MIRLYLIHQSFKQFMKLYLQQLSKHQLHQNGHHISETGSSLVGTEIEYVF